VTNVTAKQIEDDEGGRMQMKMMKAFIGTRGHMSSFTLSTLTIIKTRVFLSTTEITDEPIPC
jgi:hypothetical protein